MIPDNILWLWLMVVGLVGVLFPMYMEYRDSKKQKVGSVE